MLILIIVFLLLYFLQQVISERSLGFYRDTRFWTALAFTLIFVWLTYQRY